MIIFLPHRPFPFIVFMDAENRPAEAAGAVSPAPGPADASIASGPDAGRTDWPVSRPSTVAAPEAEESPAPADRSPLR